MVSQSSLPQASIPKCADVYQIVGYQMCIGKNVTYHYAGTTIRYITIYYILIFLSKLELEQRIYICNL